MNSQTEEILQLINKSDSELNDLSDDDYVAGKSYERRILEENQVQIRAMKKKHGKICYIKTTLWIIPYHQSL
ncbi:hypothetical protein TNCV_4233941 [Trichonephila clavipes]|nr:hypothetical protein TNCV_4233941 [Trichonephila clavipes]